MRHTCAIFIILCSLLSVACILQQSPNTNRRITVYSPEYASGFTIEEDTIAHKRILCTGGAQIPLDSPYSHLSVLSSSHVAMIELIGCTESIVGISGTGYIYSENIRKRIQSGKIKEIGSDVNLNLEAVKAAGTDLLVLYSVNGSSSRLQPKIEELKIPYILIGDYTESDPLGKAEWIVAIAALCGNMEKGVEKFHEIEERYNTTKRLVPHKEQRPSVMFNTPYRDIWYMPSSSSYMVRLIEDAGGKYIYSNPHPYSVPISMEEALLLVTSCDVWLNVGQTASMDELKVLYPKFSSTNVVKRKMVFNNDLRQAEEGGSDFWESGSVNPDLILADMISILHGNGDTMHLNYYRQLR